MFNLKHIKPYVQYNTSAASSLQVLDRLYQAPRFLGLAQTNGVGGQKRVAALSERPYDYGLKIEMVECPAGSISYGDGKTIDIDKAFELSEAPITVQQFYTAMGYDPHYYKGRIAAGYPFKVTYHLGDVANRPVEQVSWLEAVEFCNRLSLQEGLEPYYKMKEPRLKIKDPEIIISDDNPFKLRANEDKQLMVLKRSTNVIMNEASNGYRLPSMNEWLYALYANDPTYIDMPAERIAWCTVNSLRANHPLGNVNRKRQTQAVAQLIPNAFGLYDMLGNVTEWTNDLKPSKIEEYNKIEAYTIGGHIEADPKNILRIHPAHKEHKTFSDSAPIDENSKLSGFRLARTLTV
jgi:formylglycine-generating enzyme required for sulfatase activity